jgi:hypothetical protein
VGEIQPRVLGRTAADERRRIYTASNELDRIWQGEILAELPQAKLSLQSLSTLAGRPDHVASGLDPVAPPVQVEYHDHPLVIVLSQDCDLEQDFKKRNPGGISLLHNILLADVFEAAALQQKLSAEENTNSSDWRKIKGNNTPRFQFLNSVLSGEDTSSTGLPALAVDFRRYFSVRTDELYERLRLGQTKKRCRLQTPYAEHLAHRFYSYQARIPLPKEHIS